MEILWVDGIRAVVILILVGIGSVVILGVGRYRGSGDIVGRWYKGSGNIDIGRYRVSGNIGGR